MLSETQREALRDKVLFLLWELGVKVESEALGAAMLAAGCEAAPCGRLRIPARLVDDMARSQLPTAAKDASDQELHFQCGIDWAHHVIWNGAQQQIRLRGRKELLMSAFDCGPTTYYDYAAGRVAPVDTAVLVEMMKLAQASPEIGYISTWYRQDVPPRIERVASLVLALEYTDKVDGIEAIEPPTIKYLQEISQILTERPDDASYLAGSECMTSPLILERRSAADILERKRLGIHRYHVASMPTIGVATPATVAGSIVMEAAEILGGMVACFVVDPESDLSGRAIALVADMRNAQSTPTGPEPTLANLAVQELFDTWWGGHLWVEVFLSPHAHRPGLQAVFENFYGMWRTARLLGDASIPYPGMGALNCGGTGSPVQLMLDLEIRRSQFALSPTIAVDEEHLALAEMIEQARAGKDFLGSAHTARHCRELWISQLFRTDWESSGPRCGDDRSILDLCQQQWRDRVRRYEPPVWPAEKRRALAEVLKRAEAELV